MSKKRIVLILLVVIFLGYAGYELFLPNELIVNVYKRRYEDMSKEKYLQELRDFCTNEFMTQLKI